jgi:carboxyl-terminal processing protease
MRNALALVLVAACGSSTPPPAPPPPSPAPVAAQAAPAPAPAPAPPAKPADPPLPADPRLAADLKSFDFMWQRVADTFYDPKYGGLDWAAVRSELRPKVEATKTREEARAIMNQALERLRVSHFGVTGPLDDAGAQDDPGEAGIGVETRVVGAAVIVTRVEAKSPAEAAKLRLGDELVKVGDVVLAPKVADLAKKLGKSSLVSLYQARWVQSQIDGAPGSEVALSVRSGKATRTVRVPRAHVGKPVALGNLGNHYLIYESRAVEPDVGYIRLSMFLDPATVVPAIAKDLAGFDKARGVIVDFRGNPGGLAPMATGIAGYLITDQNKKLGTMRTRQASLDFVINPQTTHYAGKLAILVDDLSASTSEIFAGGMQELGRGKVFGRRTPGAALPSVIEQLPNGDRFQYAIADYVSSSGKLLEGAGVTPDVAVTLDLQALRAGKDPDMVAATRWIKEKP